MKIGIIGFGAIGKERYNALQKLVKEERLVKGSGLKLNEILIYDPFVFDFPKDSTVCSTLETMKESKPDWVFICTPHDIATLMLERVISWNTKILVEKPFCKTRREASNIFKQLKRDNQLYVGFNYRFMDGVSSLIRDYKSGLFGDIISINMKLGHGGSPKDKNGWKLNKFKSGDSCLLDPGIHMLDLLLQIDKIGWWIPSVGLSWKGFWKTEIEEEVHLLLGHRKKVIVDLEVSLVRWLSTFKIEINGTDGYGVVEGRGKSYGNQTYRRGKRWAWLDNNGKSQRESEEIVLSTDCNDSFYKELSALLLNKEYFLNPCTAKEALDAMALYEDCQGVIIK